MAGHLGKHISYLSNTRYTWPAGLTSRSEGVGDGDDSRDDVGAP